MPRILTEEHKAAMAAGRKRAADAKRAIDLPIAIERVRAWREWCKNGRVGNGWTRSPEVPTQADYILAGLADPDDD